MHPCTTPNTTLFYKKAMKNSLRSCCISLFVTCLLGACATPRTPEQRLEQMRGKSIYDIVTPRNGFLFGQDKDGNKVAFTDMKLEQIFEFQHPHTYLGEFETLCKANDGAFQLEKLGANRESGAMSEAQNQSYALGIATAKFWTNNGIYAPGEAQQTYNQQLAARSRNIRAASHIFDSAVRTESVGTFVCMNNATQKPRWRINQDLYNAHRGYSSAGGNYRTDNYSVYINQTLILYEQPTYNSMDKGGAARLQGNAKDIVYPSKGYYVVLDSREDRWRIASMRHFVIRSGGQKQVFVDAPIRTSSNQEVLITSEDGALIVPAYLADDTKFSYSDNDIGRNLCTIDNIKFPAQYSVCNSAYGDAPREVGSLMKGAAIVFGSANSTYYLNQKRTVAFLVDKFTASLMSAGVVKAVQSANSDALRQTTAASASAVSTASAKSCPDGFVASGVTKKILKARDGTIVESIRLNSGKELTLPAYKPETKPLKKIGDVYCAGVQ